MLKHVDYKFHNFGDIMFCNFQTRQLKAKQLFSNISRDNPRDFYVESASNVLCMLIIFGSHGFITQCIINASGGGNYCSSNFSKDVK